MCYKIDAMSFANRSRKYDYNSQKMQIKRINDLTQFQKGAMDRFIVKESQVSLIIRYLIRAFDPLESNVDNNPRDGQPLTENNVEG